MPPNYIRLIDALNDDELEKFVDAWQTRKSKLYVDTERYSGAGDMGRDIVGFLTNQRLEGDWHNFQCKQLKKSLFEPDMLRELAKIFFHSSNGHFCLPQKYFFICPRGVARTSQFLLDHPSKLKTALIENWDEKCAKHMVSGETHLLNSEIKNLILSFDFSNVSAFDCRRMILDTEMKPVLVEWFGADPGAAPKGVVPDAVQAEEAEYLQQLLYGYNERGNNIYVDPKSVMDCPNFGASIKTQRTRFFEAASFKRYYRDNTPDGVVEDFEDDIYHGVVDLHQTSHADVLEKVDAVISQASNLVVTGILGPYARVVVKQGTCHHFANDGILPWK